MPRHLASLALIFLVVIGLYTRVSGAYFCGYDDFLEIRRAALEDTREPLRMFTTTHFQTSKYRPLNRLLILATYRLGGGSPLWFRLRNLGFHLLATAMVYGLGWLLFQSQSTAFASALLFGLHPLANQSVVASSWTITGAYALLLTALFFFLYALQPGRRALPWLGLSLVTLWLGLFTYEATIVIFIFMYGYLAIEWWSRRRQPIATRAFLFLVAGSAAVCATFFAARLMVVSTPTRVMAAGSIVKNAVMYGGALLLPVDAVLAHEAFDAPLPPELRLSVSALALPAAAVLAVLLLIAAAVYFFRPLRVRLGKVDWAKTVFLVLCCGCSLLPFLFFTNHASETYLYLPAAFYSLLLGSILRTLLPDLWSYAVVMGIFALSFGVGTWLRNERVTACGDTAQRILSGLPLADWRKGAWSIRLANYPGEPIPARYGIYEYAGLPTIDVGDPGTPSIESALQLATLNPNLTAKVVSAREMLATCPRPDACFWVHLDGQVEPLDPKSAWSNAAR